VSDERLRARASASLLALAALAIVAFGMNVLFLLGSCGRELAELPAPPSDAVGAGERRLPNGSCATYVVDSAGNEVPWLAAPHDLTMLWIVRAVTAMASARWLARHS